MDRTDWMWIKVLVPPVLVLVLGTAAAIGVKKVASTVVIAGQPLFGGLAPFAPWVWGACAALAALCLLERFYRIWRHERGEGPSCRYCDGPLGFERQARWSAVRRCMECGRDTGEADYRRA